MDAEPEGRDTKKALLATVMAYNFVRRVINETFKAIGPVRPRANPPVTAPVPISVLPMGGLISMWSK